MSNLVIRAMRLDQLESRLLYFNDIPTRLGQVTTVAVIKDGTGTARDRFRVYGSYALAYFLEGTGEYSDANGYRQKIVPGDMVLVTPDVPHRYSSKPGTVWSECHIIFDGPLFALCRAQGILNVGWPVRHLEPVDEWLERLLSVVAEPGSQSTNEKAAEVSRLLALLQEIFGEDAELTERGTPAWLSRAKSTLDANLETEVDPKEVARELGVSYETFRKGFQKQFGTSPGQYRARRRLLVAGKLLKLTTMTNQQIAAHLGFADEFHFSKRFKQVVGVGPREYRRQGEEPTSD